MNPKKYSDKAMLVELGQRVARIRLHKNIGQAALAHEAGVSAPTVQRFEAGHSIGTEKLIRILRVLELLDTLDALVPEVAVSPLARVKMRTKERRRASTRQGDESSAEVWQWGDES